MNKHTITLKEKSFITADVIHIVCSKPKEFRFTPGQAVKLFLSNSESDDEKGAFTITSTPEDHNLEFIVKLYPSRNGFTDQIKDYKQGDTLFMSNAYGYMEYNNSGIFIAAGSGITPFISIFKMLHKKGRLNGNRLIYANDNKASIIYEKQLLEWFGSDFISILSQEKTEDNYYGLINESFLKDAIEDFTQDFYLCGPPAMMNTITGYLKGLGIDERQIIS